MVITWGGTTFNATGEDAPTLPYSVALDQGGAIYRTYSGKGYLQLNWSKYVFQIEWVDAGDSVGSYLKGLNLYSGDASIQLSYGTYSVKLIDFSIAENGYNRVNASVTFRET